MNKKHIIIRAVIIFLLAALLLPGFIQRTENEVQNKDVVFSFNYNNAYQVLSSEEMDDTLTENKKMGVNTVTIPEESLSSLASTGFLTCMNYKDIGTKFDEESAFVKNLLVDNTKISMNSFLIVTKTDEAKAFIEKWLPAKYTEDEYFHGSGLNGAEVFVIYQGDTSNKKFGIGFNEGKIADAHNRGFDISLTMMFGAYTNTQYIDYIRELTDKYNIKYINLKKSSLYNDSSDYAEENYEAMAKLIQDKNLYLVLTENQDQLSNQKPVFYNQLVKAAGGKVLRSYETADFKDLDHVSAGYHRIIHSVVDRNLRMVVINQFSSGNYTYKERSDKTNAATKLAMDKLQEFGFNTDRYDTEYDYTVNRRFNSVIGFLLMMVMGITMVEILFGKRYKWLEIAVAVMALLGAVFTLKAPESLICLYPTLFSLLASCFAITVVMAYIKWAMDRLSTVLLTITTVLVTLITLMLCGYVQTVLLAGLDYYLNSLIFRGIKISLILPILYSFVAYGLIFVKQSDYAKRILAFLNMEIKVYWVALGVCAMGAALIYLIRSGNVTNISSIEEIMRNSIAERIAARPRTKEFLIGWPALVLFVYYAKNSNIQLLKWGFAVGSSILFASVINSYCHVFTSAEIINERVLNGALLGAVIAVFAIVANAVIIKLVRWCVKKYDLDTGR